MKSGDAAWMKIVLAAVVSLLACTNRIDGDGVGDGDEDGPRASSRAATPGTRRDHHRRRCRRGSTRPASRERAGLDRRARGGEQARPRR